MKTDKVDSETLARLLRLDSIPRAHKIKRELRDLRDVMRARLRLVQKRTCGHELVIDEQVIPEHLPEAYRLHLRNLYDQISLLDTQIAGLEHFLKPVLIPNDDIQRLVWIPGVGATTAFTVYLETDGIDRFLSDKHFVSYCRLVPGGRNSNKSIRHKSGSKDGNKYLQYFPEYSRLYHKILRRANEPIARTVVAKELARIVYHSAIRRPISILV